MSKNIKLNDTDYNGISTVQLPTVEGGTASFKDIDEIVTGGENANIATGEYTPAEDMIYPSNAIINHGLGVVPDLIYFIAEDASSILGNGETITAGGVFFKYGDITVKEGGATTKSTSHTLISDGTNMYFSANVTVGSRPRVPGPTETDFCLWNLNNSYKIKGGVKLKWYAVKFK